MKYPTAMPRRRALSLAALACAAAWIADRAGFNSPSSESTEHAALLALAAQLDCRGSLGDHCRNALPPAEASQAEIARSLVAVLRAADGRSIAPAAVAKALQRRSRQDFRAGRVAMVDGWMLSLTETRLYTLAAFLRSGHGNVT